jgi:hypothetical protein
MKWINTRGRNLRTAEDCRVELPEKESRKAHPGMAQANAGKGNPNAGI